MSWVIVNKETDEPVFETYLKSITLKINTKKYKAVPIKEWLSSLNKKLVCDCLMPSIVGTPTNNNCIGCGKPLEQ